LAAGALADLSPRELVALLVLAAAVAALGLIPGPLLRMIEAPLAAGIWSPWPRLL